MANIDVKTPAREILTAYDPAAPVATADALRDLWLQFEPKGVGGIKRELRDAQDNAGIPVAALKAIGTDVKKATSFAIRIATRGEIAPVREFLARHVPPEDPAATWVLCDVIRSMTKRFLPDFAALLPRYERWAADPDLAARDRRSVESAVRTLQKHAV